MSIAGPGIFVSSIFQYRWKLHSHKRHNTLLHIGSVICFTKWDLCTGYQPPPPLTHFFGLLELSLERDATVEGHYHAPPEQVTCGANVDIGKGKNGQTSGREEELCPN